MATPTNATQLSEPPVRHLRLLANFAPGFAIVFALIALGLAGSTIAMFAQMVTGTTAPQLPWSVVLLTFNLAATALAAVIAYRLGLDVPRTVREWHTAMTERSNILHHR